jgi:hypothetical protein
VRIFAGSLHVYYAIVFSPSKAQMSHFCRSALFSTLIAALAGCGGGSGSPSTPTPSPVAPTPPAVVAPPPPPAPSAFTIVSGTPADAAVSAPRDQGYLATFSAAPDPASITAETVQLKGPLGNVLPATLSVNGAELRLNPVPALPGGTRYTVTFASAIKDKDARPLEVPVSRSFTTAAQQWSAASQITESPSLTSGDTPRVAIDKLGNVTAVWRHQTSGITKLLASRFDPRSGNWSAPAVIHADDNVFAIGGFNVQADGNGNAYVLATTYSNVTQQSIMLARFSAATSTWAPVLPFSGLPGMVAENAVFAADGKGVLTVVFRAGYPSALFGARFDPATSSWSAPQEIEQRVADTNIFNEQIVADSAGNVTLAWVQRGGLHPGMNVARYSAQTGKWSAPHTIETNFASQPFALAADVAGGAAIAWTHGGGMMDVPYIAAARFDAASATWSMPARVSAEGDSLGAGMPAIVTDAAGITTVAWRQSGAMYSARLGGPTPTWSVPERVGTVDPGTGALSLMADVAGNVALLYVESKVPKAMRYEASEAKWSAPAALGSPAGTTPVFANDPVSVMDASGNLTTVWLASLDVAGMARLVVAASRFH